MYKKQRRVHVQYDEQILKCLKAKPGQRAGELEDVLQGPIDNIKGFEFSRDVGSSLQRLRKEGKIRVEKTRWYLVDTAVCPTCKGKGKGLVKVSKKAPPVMPLKKAKKPNLATARSMNAAFRRAAR
jgi:hypothetical protein